MPDEIERKFVLDAPPQGLDDHPSRSRSSRATWRSTATSRCGCDAASRPLLTVKAGGGRHRVEQELALGRGGFARAAADRGHGGSSSAATSCRPPTRSRSRSTSTRRRWAASSSPRLSSPTTPPPNAFGEARVARPRGDRRRALEEPRAALGRSTARPRRCHAAPPVGCPPRHEADRGSSAPSPVLAFAWWRRRRPAPLLLVGACWSRSAPPSTAPASSSSPTSKKLLTDLGRALGTWTYLLVGVLCFLESGAGIGLLIPGETAIIVGGVVAGQGQIDIVLLIAIAWTARRRRRPLELLDRAPAGAPVPRQARPALQDRRAEDRAGRGVSTTSTAARPSSSAASSGSCAPSRRSSRAPRGCRCAASCRTTCSPRAPLCTAFCAARLPLLALARQSPEDRQTGDARARHGDRRRRRDRRRGALAACRGEPRPARRLGRARRRPKPVIGPVSRSRALGLSPLGSGALPGTASRPASWGWS